MPGGMAWYTPLMFPAKSALAHPIENSYNVPIHKRALPALVVQRVLYRKFAGGMAENPRFSVK